MNGWELRASGKGCSLSFLQGNGGINSPDKQMGHKAINFLGWLCSTAPLESQHSAQCSYEWVAPSINPHSSLMTSSRGAIDWRRERWRRGTYLLASGRMALGGSNGKEAGGKRGGEWGGRGFWEHKSSS